MNKTDIKFNNLIGELNDEQFFKYVNSWYDEQNYLDIMNNWDEETKKEAIKDIKKILKQ